MRLSHGSLGFRTSNTPALHGHDSDTSRRLRRWATRLAAAAGIALALAPAACAQETPGPSATSNPSETLCQPQVLGNRRIPKDTILARLFSHAGDNYDPVTIERDFNSLWNTGYFEDVRIEREDTPRCVQLIIVVREKPTIREISYPGLNVVSQSDVLDRFKKEHVGLTVESQYDPEKVAHARAVLLQMLGEHGHQFATIKVDLKTIPPAAVTVTFRIKEGPTVKVGNIRFTGNHALPARQLRSAMVNLKPIGIPHSIIFENLFARTYDASKLEEDVERVVQDYQDHGYFRAEAGDPETKIRDQGGFSFLTLHPRHGKRIDITIPITENGRYRLAGINFHGNKAVTNLKALRAQFPIKDGEWFNRTDVGKGLENLRKAYGALGYINFTAIPTPHADEAKHTVTLDIDIDEGKPFYVSRIEFSGNTITRDRVIRRELLLEEGQVYNSKLWEASLLRLNQLNYFNPLRVEQDSETHQNQEAGTVDLLLKLTEKGKNSIGLNGGISGLSGAFIGTNYQTNNFLGLGETLTVQANLGDLSRNLQFGFTEPYLQNRPLSLGFQVFTSKYDYNAAKNPFTAGANLNLNQQQQNLIQNYNQSTTGFNVSLSYPIRRSWKRVGITYSFSDSSVQAFSQASTNLFQTIAFRSFGGQNALTGILTSGITPSFLYSTVNSGYRPTAGKSFSAAVQFTGLGGNVRYVTPVVEFKQFRTIHGLHFSPTGRNVFGYRIQANYTTGYGGQVTPPFQRFYAGGDNDLRGFDVRSTTPYAFVPTRVLYNLANGDGSYVPKDPSNPQQGYVQIPLPVYTIASIGGDTEFIQNTEYRIPIAGPVAFSLFNDFGMNFVLKDGQLRETTQGYYQLTSALYGCPVLTGDNVCTQGQRVSFRNTLSPISGTNFVPRDSIGAEISVLLPVVQAPFRIYYAYNPLRLYHTIPAGCPTISQIASGIPFTPQPGAAPCLLSASLFPQKELPISNNINNLTGAGQYTFGEALSLYGQQYLLREPRKTFRFSVSTTF